MKKQQRLKVKRKKNDVGFVALIGRGISLPVYKGGTEMNEFVSDLLPLLLMIYVCVGVVVACALCMYFIAKNDFSREHFAQCVEAIVFYGPVLVYCAYKGTIWLVKFLATRDYKGSWERQKENFQAWNKKRKKERKFNKQLRTERKK